MHISDPLLETVVTPELVADGLEADAYHLGLSAYLWGYPLVRMERVCREYTDVPDPRPATSYRAPLNEVGWATRLADPDSHDMPTANYDTLYMSAVVDLVEPFVLTVPDVGDRYYVVNVFTMYQELEHYVGRRTTGTGAGRFVIVPPGWQGDVPADAVRLDVSTRKVWLWGRIRVSDGEDLAPVVELQRGFTLEAASGRSVAEPLPPLPDVAGDELGFFTHLGAAMGANPVFPADTALVAQLARIGLTPDGFDPAGLTDRQRAALVRALADGPAAAQAAFATTAEDRHGWTWVLGMDDFGFNYPRRAVIAGPYLGGNGEREAMYPGGFTDSQGRADRRARLPRALRRRAAGRRLLVAHGVPGCGQDACRQRDRPVQGRLGHAGTRRRRRRVHRRHGVRRSPVRRRELAPGPGRAVLPDPAAVPAAGRRVRRRLATPDDLPRRLNGSTTASDAPAALPCARRWPARVRSANAERSPRVDGPPRRRGLAKNSTMMRRRAPVVGGVQSALGRAGIDPYE